MISNERQYRSAVRQRKDLAAALDERIRTNSDLFAPRTPSDRTDAQSRLRFQIEEAALSGQISDLDDEISDYESLRAGTTSVIRVSSFAELPEALVRARIAQGLTQRDLASRLGIKEQQVQRYETDRYAGASLARLRETIAALGVELTADVELPDAEVPIAQLRKRLVQLGLDRRMVDRRLLRGVMIHGTGTGKFLELAEHIARLLAVTRQQLLSDDPLPALATSARFKAPKNAAPDRIDAYTRYAESIADIVLRATEHLGPSITPPGSQEVRAGIEEAARSLATPDPVMNSSDTLFNAALTYVANLRIPVVALRDPGAFHGACFTKNDRSIIVIKQTTDSPAQWLTNLLHELDHARDPDREESRGWLELGDINLWSDHPVERHANDFASDVVFSGRATSVLELCLHRAQGSVERLKSAVQSVADEADVPIDVLANQLAFLLSKRGINWWATAASMQERGMPWHDVNDRLLQQLDMQAIDAFDRTALLDLLAA